MADQAAAAARRGPGPRSAARKPKRKPAKPEGKAPASSQQPREQDAQPSPLQQAVDAARHGRDQELDALLPQVDVNERTPRGDALLVEACRFARAELAARLVNELKADVNLASANKSANRAGMTPLIAACMALQPAIVDVLLGSSFKVDLLLAFGKVNAATVCVLFSVPNGRTEEQNEKATAILEKLVDYAARTEQLEELLEAKPDQVNPLLHVAAALSNWRVIEFLEKKKAYGEVGLHAARNARGHTALHSLEMNAFQARSLQMCEPPRPNADGYTDKHGKKGPKQRQNRRGKQKKDEQENSEVENEPQSEADRQTFTRSRPSRSVEAEHVTKTVIELSKSTGIAAIFSRKGDNGVRAIYIKSLILAEFGVVKIANEIAEIPAEHPEKPVYLDGLLYSVTGMYPLAVKNPKEYRNLWQRAVYGELRPKKKRQTGTPLGGDAVAPPQTSVPALSPAAFLAIYETLMSHRSLSRRLKVWSIILMSALGPYEGIKPLAEDSRPPLEQCSKISFYRRINETLYRSGVKLLFSIFDRTDIEEDESYDEEIEFHLMIALFEHFLQFFVPYARTIIEDSAKEGTPESLNVSESFRRAVAPVTNLWSMLRAGLENLDDAIASPQRFSLILHILQIYEQLQVAFDQNASSALNKLFRIMKTFVKQEATKKRVDEYVVAQVRLLQTVSNAFPLPSSFIEKLEPLKDKVDMLLRSDPKILGVDLYALAAAGNGLVRLEHKVDYLGVLAEEHNGSVSVSISRASGANYVDFILQQVLSAGARHLKGELNVTLINEPGVGIGVVREFFQIVQSCFFNPEYNLTGNGGLTKSKPAQHVSEIGSKWLEDARAQTSPHGSGSRVGRKKNKREEKPKTNEMTSLFPLFELIDATNKRSDDLRITRRRPLVTKAVLDGKRANGELSLALKDLVVDKAREDSLKKIYQCVGRLLGLAIRNHQPLDSSFPLSFWKFMCSKKLTWQDQCEGNDVFARSLQQILDHDFDAEPLDLQFEHTSEVDVVSDAEAKTKIETVTMEVELQSNMGQERVTNANKAKYVELRANQYFFGTELGLYEKIREGLLDTIRRPDLRLFQPAELRRVVRGERNIDIDSLKKSVLYSRGASPAHGVIQRFWEVVEHFDQSQRAQLLTFWSGSPLPPVFGFESKHRSMNADTACWYIDVDPRMEPNQCPMANTCDRRLIIPDYPTEAQLKQKLLVALEHGAVGYDRM